eukprot:7211436-Pyramimonas_sp.AAC.1
MKRGRSYSRTRRDPPRRRWSVPDDRRGVGNTVRVCRAGGGAALVFQPAPVRPDRYTKHRDGHARP